MMVDVMFDVMWWIVNNFVVDYLWIFVWEDKWIKKFETERKCFLIRENSNLWLSKFEDEHGSRKNH